MIGRKNIKMRQEQQLLRERKIREPIFLVAFAVNIGIDCAFTTEIMAAIIAIIRYDQFRV